jgi:hypothetical protein
MLGFTSALHAELHAASSASINLQTVNFPAIETSRPFDLETVNGEAPEILK